MKKFLPDLIAILAFIVISFIYFFPAITEDRILFQHDTVAGAGAGQEAKEYYERTGERTRWTNALFGGMPTYQMSPSYDSTEPLTFVQKVYHLFLPNYVWLTFIMMLGFYIQSNAISITDGMGSCSISSGAITFNGIRNSKIFEWPYEKDSYGNPKGKFTAQTTRIDLSSYSSVMLVYDTNKSGTWLASGGNAGRLTVILPVNGQTYSYAYPWNTVHWRTVKVSSTGMTFGSGNERTSSYGGVAPVGVWSFNLQNPGGDGVNTNDEVCRPLELYGFM